MQIKLLTFLFIGFSLLTQAQKFTNSPFSSYGIGEAGGLDHATFSGMGNSTIALLDTTILNFYNPSSYASLGKGQPLFSTGISAKFSNYAAAGNSYNAYLAGLDHFALGIPFGKRFGIAFGLKPFSRTGYEFSDKKAVAEDSMSYIYRGSGGTHEVFGGLSANILKIKNHRLGVGTNLGYIFGSNVNERVAYLSGGIAGGVENKGYSLRSFHYDLGLNYLWDINKYQSLTIAAIYTPEQQLTASRNEFLAYTSNITNPNTYSYLSYLDGDKGKIVMPATMGAGFSFTTMPDISIANNRTKIYQLTVTGEFKITDWSAYATDFSGMRVNGGFANTTRFSVGAQFTPHYNFLDRSTTIGYLNRVRYRAGFYRAELPLVVQSKQQSDMGVTVGFGLPIAIQRSSSSINFGITAGKRGNGLDESLNERYIGFNFGVTISPGYNDRWFRKFKID